MPNKKLRRQSRHARRVSSRVEAASNQDVVFAAESIEVDLEAQGGDQSTPTANVTAYTGGKLALTNFQHPAVINLAGVRAMSDRQLPFLRDHDQKKAVGHGTPIIASDHLQHEGRLSVPGEERDKIIAASKADFSWQASIEDFTAEFIRNTNEVGLFVKEKEFMV